MAALARDMPGHAEAFTAAQGEKMGVDGGYGSMFSLGWPAPPYPGRRRRTHWEPLPLNGQKGMNPRGKSRPAANQGKNGGRSHNRKRSR